MGIQVAKFDFDWSRPDGTDSRPAFRVCDPQGSAPGLNGGGGWIIRTPVFSILASVEGLAGPDRQNRIPTPSSPEVWRIGFIHNVIKCDPTTHR